MSKSNPAAQTPAVSKVGSKPIAAVATPMRVIVTRKVYFRPILSPKYPNNIAPNGRTPKPAPKIASDANVAAVGLSAGKNSFPINAANMPYTKKSYHSNTVPSDDAVITRRSRCGSSVTSVSAALAMMFPYKPFMSVLMPMLKRSSGMLRLSTSGISLCREETLHAAIYRPLNPYYQRRGVRSARDAAANHLYDP